MKDEDIPHTPITTPLRRLFSPVVATIALIIWTAAVAPFSTSESRWALWPALSIPIVVVIWHIVLIYLLRGERRYALGAGILHLMLLIPVWFTCLIYITKDGP